MRVAFKNSGKFLLVKILREHCPAMPESSVNAIKRKHTAICRQKYVPSVRLKIVRAIKAGESDAHRIYRDSPWPNAPDCCHDFRPLFVTEIVFERNRNDGTCVFIAVPLDKLSNSPWSLDDLSLRVTDFATAAVSVPDAAAVCEIDLEPVWPVFDGIEVRARPPRTFPESRIEVCNRRALYAVINMHRPSGRKALVLEREECQPDKGALKRKNYSDQVIGTSKTRGLQST